MIPAISTATINDLIPQLQLILQNRQDISQYNPSLWLQRAIQNITQRIPFEELRVTGPQVPLIVSQYSYPVSYFVNSGDDYTTPVAVNVFTDFPNNTVAFPLHYDTPTGLRPLTFIPGGLPGKWTRFGTNIWTGPQPNQPYTSFMDYQKRHPFNDQNVGSSAVLLSPEWHEVVEYCAAFRMCLGPLRWPDMAQEFGSITFTNPNNPGVPMPIRDLYSQAQLDQQIHSRRINFRMH